jgi:hypothetical protein
MTVAELLTILSSLPASAASAEVRVCVDHEKLCEDLGIESVDADPAFIRDVGIVTLYVGA